MNRMQRILHTLASIFSAAALWLATVPALAADSAGGKPGEGGASDYLLSYVVVLLAIVLGMYAVAMPSNRRDRDRPEGYVSQNIEGEH